MNRLFIRSAAVLVAGLALVTTAGCAASSTRVQSTDAWTHRMGTLLADPNGNGGGFGTLTGDSGEKTGSALVELATANPGHYDVLGVCRGGDVVHLRALYRTPENNSGTFKPLASTNVVCGATTRLSITIPGHDVVVKASGRAGTDWVAQVVTRGWQPDPGTGG